MRREISLYGLYAYLYATLLCHGTVMKEESSFHIYMYIYISTDMHIHMSINTIEDGVSDAQTGFR